MLITEVICTVATCKHGCLEAGRCLGTEYRLNHAEKDLREREKMLRADMEKWGVQPSQIDMVLYCPQCNAQHVDKPTNCTIHDCHLYGVCYAEKNGKKEMCDRWTNPPHRSHLCAACGTVWRPADVPTNGVSEVKTRGKDDTWPNLNPVCANCDTPVPPGCNGLFEKGKGCALNGGRTMTSEEFRRLHMDDEADFFDTQTRRGFEHG